MFDVGNCLNVLAAQDLRSRKLRAGLPALFTSIAESYVQIFPFANGAIPTVAGFSDMIFLLTFAVEVPSAHH